MIYAIQAVGTSFIKFGRAKNVGKRLFALETACPCDLRLLIAADWPDGNESGIHRFLSKSHHKGEWFTDSDRSRLVIQWLTEGEQGRQQFLKVCEKERRLEMGSKNAQVLRAQSRQERRRAERKAWWAREMSSDRGVGTTCCGALGQMDQ